MVKAKGVVRKQDQKQQDYLMNQLLGLKYKENAHKSIASMNLKIKNKV